jgi:hypothetical protein
VGSDQFRISLEQAGSDVLQYQEAAPLTRKGLH